MGPQWQIRTLDKTKGFGVYTESAGSPYRIQPD